MAVDDEKLEEDPNHDFSHSAIVIPAVSDLRIFLVMLSVRLSVCHSLECLKAIHGSCMCVSLSRG